MKTACPRYALASAACLSLLWATPLEARFLQVDPVGYDDQINLYVYVGNDPVNMRDPQGTDALWVQNPDGSITLIIPVFTLPVFEIDT